MTQRLSPRPFSPATLLTRLRLGLHQAMHPSRLLLTLCALALMVALVAAYPLTLVLAALSLAVGCALLLVPTLRPPQRAGLALITSAAAALLLIVHTAAEGPTPAPGGTWPLTIAAWLMAWQGVNGLSRLADQREGHVQRLFRIAIPLIFGAWIIILWQIITTGFDIPAVLLPPPGMIAARLVGSADLLWADFVQTVLIEVLVGFTLGTLLGIAMAILADRSPFLKRGLLPLGSLASALPIIGVAPIMVMWFGFDWPSKVAVVVLMTFFPMLVNTTAGLAATTAQQRDLMKTYASGYGATLLHLRLPAALPMIFNGLKICSTLALIGAIVAEFFGTPTVGMGFRISTSFGSMDIDMVWAQIVVAALAGTSFYGLIALIERRATFWHPSQRR